MTEINPRPSFFPNSSSTQSGRTRSTALSGDLATTRTNSPARTDELVSTTGEHARVEIPESVKDFSNIKKAVDQAEPRDNSSKIADLKQRIQNGQYSVDYDAVADKMINSEF